MLWAALITLTLAVGPVSAAEDLDECRALFAGGEYEPCIARTAEAIANRRWGESWAVLKARSELAIGRVDDAATTARQGLERYRWSVRLRLVGHRAWRAAGYPEVANRLLNEIAGLARQSAWRYTDARNLVALGRAALATETDPREVLEELYDRARRQDPKALEPFLAAAELALEKHDPELARELFTAAAKHHPRDADVNFGLARTASDPAATAVHLARTFDANPRHVPALLFTVDRLVDGEQYRKARAQLERVLAINPTHPLAWAWRSLLARFENDPRDTMISYRAALSGWKTNPAVDHLIGRELSQKYRFADGAAHQRRALALDPRFVPARTQLAQDLLRLGDEPAGWTLIDQAHQQDGYDLVTFNLLELKRKLDTFTSLESKHFVVRMAPREAAVYGRSVLELLEAARGKLGARYGFPPAERTIVEIFPDGSDFAVRTFGLPVAGGYLGVCFGRVITATSPAVDRGGPTNWRSVLWHEFCHSVTLARTRHRIPRWLSEGISVYEETLADARWGQRMTPRHRRMILDDGTVPIRRLSDAFLSPPSPAHLQFAYYQSSLAVRFLVERHGPEALDAVLRDLRAGLRVNEALERHTAGLDRFEHEFAGYVRKLAEQLAPDADFSQPDLGDLLNDDTDRLAAWLTDHPSNLSGLSARADQLIEQEDWAAAARVLDTMISLFPGDVGPSSPYRRLALVHHRRRDASAERQVLRRLVDRDATARTSLLRLLELEADADNWPAVLETAEAILAIDPLIPAPHRAAAVAAERLDRPGRALAAWRAVLALDPNDPAEIHFRLAQLLHRQGSPEARRQVLMALQFAPRFRKAHKLLLEIVRTTK